MVTLQITKAMTVSRIVAMTYERRSIDVKVVSEGYNLNQGEYGGVGILVGAPFVALIGHPATFLDGHISSFHCG
ncbi:MAG: hypothetical protein CM15mP82_0780 [Methanobacteriota archaeon]|nr:MAG: hypothetical protein CM15mP82_0780 [Euryarchaeota archaeon]